MKRLWEKIKDQWDELVVLFWAAYLILAIIFWIDAPFFVWGPSIGFAAFLIWRMNK